MIVKVRSLGVHTVSSPMVLAVSSIAIPRQPRRPMGSFAEETISALAGRDRKSSAMVALLVVLGLRRKPNARKILTAANILPAIRMLAAS